MAVIILLFLSLTLSGYLWHQLAQTEPSPPHTVASKPPDSETNRYSPDITSEAAAVMQAELDAALSRLATSERERRQLLERFSEIRREINKRLGSGPEVQTLVTPHNPLVAAKVRELTGGYSEDADEYWRDFGVLYRWVQQNIEYCPDSYTPVIPESINEAIGWTKECWRTPEETLQDGVGDCEDMSLLLASMLLSYNEERYGIWVIGIGNSERGHAAVAIPVENGKLTILDPSFHYATGPNQFIINCQEISEAVTHWLARWEEEIPGVHIYVVFNDKFYQDFTGTQEFIGWAYSVN